VIDGDRPDTPPPPQALAVDGLRVQELPVMGKIAAGVPIEAISEVSHSVAVPGQMLGGKGSHYALEVKGDSMIDAGINDGDVVVIRETQTADDGEIVVALVEDHEATLKRILKRGNTIALEAANPAYETRVFPADKVKVQGTLVGLIRTY
jgi:repressor LexA